MPKDENDELKVVGLDISANNKIYCGYSQGNIRVYNFNDNILSMEKEYLGHLSGIKTLVLSKNDETMVTGAKDGSGRLWNKDSCQFIRSLNGHKDNMCTASFCPGERKVATAAWD